MILIYFSSLVWVKRASLYFIIAQFILGIATLRAQETFPPVKNFNIPDSNIFVEQRAMGAVGSIGCFLNDQSLFVAKGTTNPKGKLFNLMSSNPSLSTFYIVSDEDGIQKRLKVKTDFEQKHGLDLLSLQSNNQGTAVIGAGAKGGVAVWLRKMSPPSEKKIDYTFKIIELKKIFSNKPVRSLRIAPDDEHIAVLGTPANEVLLWLQSLRTKPGKYIHDRAIYAMDFNPLAPENLAIGDSIGRIMFVVPRFPGAYTKEFFVSDSLALPKREPISLLRFTPAGEHLLVLTKKRNLYVYNTRSLSPFGKIAHIHDSLITNIAFLKEPNYFVTSSLDRTAKVWSLEFMKPIFTIRKNNPITDISASSKDNLFMLFDSKDSAYQYYFNDYILNSFFILNNIQKDLEIDFRLWLKKREHSKPKDFMQLSKKTYLQNRLLKLVRSKINKYVEMAFYKNIVTLKTQGYENYKGLLSCSMDGFEGNFKLKIDPKDTNFFKANVQQNKLISEVEAKIADDGGIILDKAKIAVKEKTFWVVPNTEREEQEEPMIVGFSVDSLMTLFLSSLKSLKVDSMHISRTFFASDVDTVKLSVYKKQFMGRQKTAFIGICNANYKDPALENIFLGRDLKKVTAFFANLLSIPKKQQLVLPNLTADKLKKMFIASQNSKGELVDFLTPLKVPEIFIYFGGNSVYSANTQKDYFLPAEARQDAPEKTGGIAWKMIVRYLNALPAKRVNVFVDSDVQDQSIFDNLNPKVVVILVKKKKKRLVNTLFHNSFTYAMLRTWLDKEATDLNHDRSISMQELALHMQKLCAENPKWGIDVALFSQERQRIFFGFKAPKPKPIAKAQSKTNLENKDVKGKDDKDKNQDNKDVKINSKDKRKTK